MRIRKQDAGHRKQRLPAIAVIPAEAGIHVTPPNMDSRFRGNDGARVQSLFPVSCVLFPFSRFLLPPQALSDSLIRSASDSVFSQGVYNRLSLWQRFWGWVFDMLLRVWAFVRPLAGMLRRSPLLYWTVIGLLVALVVAIIARAIYLWHERRNFDAAALTWESSPLKRAGRDPWSAAEELSAQGDFTSAAHALYAAILDNAARAGQIRLHPSKTAGDYVRELRGRSSSLFTAFRDFARSYDTVIYGVGSCDEERYHRLHALAAPAAGRARSEG